MKRLHKFRRTRFVSLSLALGLLLVMSLPPFPIVNASLESPSSSSIGWQPGFMINGTNGGIYDMVTDGQNVYAAGSFTIAGDVVANGVDRWDGGEWHTLGNGLEGYVGALALDGRGHLYAASRSLPGTNWYAEIFRWDGSTWQSLHSNPNGVVFSLAWDGSQHLIAGGEFTSIGGISANRIAEWDGARWEPLGNGIDSDYPVGTYVRTLAFDRFGLLYVGGSFTHASGLLVNNIARWDGNTWAAFDDGVSGTNFAWVNALTFDGRGNLYAAGSFSKAGSVSANSIARWNGSEWSSLGDGPIGEINIKIGLEGLAADGNTIYASGYFQSTGGSWISDVQRWNGNTWELVGDPMTCEDSFMGISALTVDRDGNLFAGGQFCFVGSLSANNIALWDGNAWHALGADTSVNNEVYSIVLDAQDRLYAGGKFTAAGGRPANHIAMWDGQRWDSLAGGVTDGMMAGYDYPASVLAMAIDRLGNLYVGGNFLKAGSIDANHIAMWDGSQWHALGSGLDSLVHSIAIDSQGMVYAAGPFGHSGNTVVNQIARWNGVDWEPVGNWPDGYIYSLAIDSQDRVYAGSYQVVRWDGINWEELTGWPGDYVSAVAIVNEQPCAGGSGTVQCWDGGAWKELGAIAYQVNYPGAAYFLLPDQLGNIYVGGDFPGIGGLSANNLAWWHARRWEPLEEGLNGQVNALAVNSKEELVAAGQFSIAGNVASPYLARWIKPNVVWLPQVFK